MTTKTHCEIEQYIFKNLTTFSLRRRLQRRGCLSFPLARPISLFVEVGRPLKHHNKTTGRWHTGKPNFLLSIDYWFPDLPQTGLAAKMPTPHVARF